jgi:DNA (cytosine-5)-methyltransferase 1
MASVEAIDLFCGSGGLTHGLIQAGVDVLAGLDSDSTCEYAYEANNSAKFISADIAAYSGGKLLALYSAGAIKVLAGCAPCQTFSKHTQKNKNRDQDKKWNLLYQFSNKIKEINPDIVSMENVPGLAKYPVFKDFLSALAGMGYKYSYKVVSCEKYGIPQTRRRLVLLASKLGEINLIPYTHPKPADFVTVKDVFSKHSLPAICRGEGASSDLLHKSADLSNLNLKRIQNSRPGGTWSEWDKSLLPECYKKSSGKTYSSVYGRMSWNKPSPTITTQFYVYGTGRFGHPEQDRAISLREGALLQTFPVKYKLLPPKGNVVFKTIGRHIGNAVPVRLGCIIGKSILKHVDEKIVG